MTLAQASQAIHIRVRYLDALEQGRLNELPGLAYTKGYLQAYAAFLELDKDEILRRFEQLEDGLSRRGFYLPQAFAKEKSAAPWTIWGGLGAALVAYLFWLAFMQPSQKTVSVVDDFHKAQSQEAAKPRDGACFEAQTVLYPPCYAEPEPAFNLMLLQGHLSTVMQLVYSEPDPDSEL